MTTSVLPTHFRDCVVALGQRDRKRRGGIHWAATGFFVLCDPPPGRNDVTSRYLVSCRHVFEGKKEMFLRINRLEREPAKTCRVKLVDATGRPRWHAPSAAVLDVAVLPVKGVLEGEDRLKLASLSTENSLANRTDLRSLDVAEGDPVCLLGYPRGSVDWERNDPIAEDGRITRLDTYTNGQLPVVLVDALCLPGNSGSPVIVLTNGDSGISDDPIGEAYLMGVVAGTVRFSSTVNGRPSRRARAKKRPARTRVIPADFITRSIQLHRASPALAA